MEIINHKCIICNDNVYSELVCSSCKSNIMILKNREHDIFIMLEWYKQMKEKLN